MRKLVWIEIAEALVIHDMLLAEHGGREGVRDIGLLDSALSRPKNLLAYSQRRPPLAALAAAYAFGIVTNHPFIDGNKRTALVVAFSFLALNGTEIVASEEEIYLMFMALAEGKISEKPLAQWLEQHSEPAP